MVSPMSFTKKIAEDLKNELLELFHALHNGTINLSGVNCAFITLLPKCDTPLKIMDYRPIALQHSIPKLIAKVLSNRLQPKIKYLVDQM